MPPTGARITELLARARTGDPQAREELLAQLKPFAGHIAARTAGRTLAWENDDELGVAFCALNEAIDAYDPEAGAGFQSFAAQVIRRRLIDYLRREERHRRVASLEQSDLEPVAPPPEDEAGDLPLAVAALRRELQPFGLDFADLVAASPKHCDTREALIHAARVIAAKPDLRRIFDAQRRLPLRETARETGLSRRVLERGRRYIVALVLILTRPELFPLRTFARLDRDLKDEKERCKAHGRP